MVAVSGMLGESLAAGSEGGSSCCGDLAGTSDNCREVEGADGADTCRVTEDANETADACRER